MYVKGEHSHHYSLHYSYLCFQLKYIMYFLHVHPYFGSHTTVISNVDIILRYSLPLQTHIPYMYIKIKYLKYLTIEMSKLWVTFLE